MWEFLFSMLWNFLSSFEGLVDSPMNSSGPCEFLRSNYLICLNFLYLLGSILVNNIFLGSYLFNLHFQMCLSRLVKSSILRFLIFLLFKFFFFLNLFYLFIFGCVGSSLRCTGFSLRWPLLLRSTGSRHAGFSS